MTERPRIETDTQSTASERVQERKPYVAPTLRRLGLVRDLTLGSTSGCLSESGKATFAKAGGM
jgi:hypothetical protein